MNLTLYTVLTGIIACFSGCILIINSIKVKCLLKELLRSNKASIILLSIGLFWFQYHHVRNLGEADFGEYSIMGAQQGRDFGNYYRNKPQTLHLINDYKWLREKFDESTE